MAAYIRFYRFDASPFDNGNAKPGLVLGTQSLRGALAKVKQGLTEDSPRICLTGSAGVGKTSFSRALPKLLAGTAQVAVILDPSKPWRELRTTIAKRFHLDGGAISRRALLDVRKDAKQLVLVVDHAETLSHESLDHLDILLQYKCENDNQLLHCVMLANLDAASTGIEIPLLWWLDKFTTLQLQLSPIPAEGLRHYVEKHLAKAGWAGGELFSQEALVAIHRNTGGIPRAINELCERILIEGGRCEISSISADFIEMLCGEASSVEHEAGSRDSLNDLSAGRNGASTAAPKGRPDRGLKTDHPAPGRKTPDNRTIEPVPAVDITNLLITRDSPEMLEVAGTEAHNAEDSPGLELVNEPNAFAQPGFYDHPQSIGAPIGMAHAAARTRSGRSPIVVALALGVAAWLGYTLYARIPEPARLIQSAEVKIVEAIEKQTGRKAELTGQSVGSADPDPANAQPLLDTSPGAFEAAQRSEAFEPRDSAIQQAAIAPPERALPSSTRVLREPIVINEYTAIPESASSAAPTPAKIAPDSNTR